MGGVIFVGTIMGSSATKSSSLDLWGDVKIPKIEIYEGVESSIDSDGW